MSNACSRAASTEYGRHLHFPVSSLYTNGPMALRIHKANPTPFTLQCGSVSVSTLLGRSAYSPMEAHRELGAVTRSRPSSNQHTQLGVVHFYSHVPCPSSHVHTKGIRQLFSHWTLGSALDRPPTISSASLFFSLSIHAVYRALRGFFCWV